MIKSILAAAVIGAAAMGAQAATNLVDNGSFDGSTSGYVYNDVPVSIANAGVGVPTQSGTVSDWDGSFVSIASSNGAWWTPSSLANFNVSTQGGYIAGIQADGTLSQTLDLAAGTYLLTWVDANRGNNQSYSVSFDGGTTTYLSTSSFGTTQGAGWKTESLAFTTTGGTGTLTFSGGTVWGQADATSFIDNVSLSAVPESSSMLMMVLGTLGLLAWRRRAQV